METNEPEAEKKKPTPFHRTAMVFVGGAAALAVAVACLLPWHTKKFLAYQETEHGFHYVEGIVSLSFAALSLGAFLLILLQSKKFQRRTLAFLTLLFSFAMACAPAVRIIRGAASGEQSISLGEYGYIGWTYGIRIALLAGFVGIVASAMLLRTALRRFRSKRKPVKAKAARSA